MKQIDKKSEALIARVEKRFDNDLQMYELMSNVVDRVRDYYMSMSYDALKRKVLAKMAKGALEHGEPDIKKVPGQFEQECDDLLGWTLYEMEVHE